MQSVRQTLGDVFGALVLCVPGLAVAAFYVRRLEALRCDGQRTVCEIASAGTPGETWLAIFCGGLVIASARLAIASGAGRLSLRVISGAVVGLSIFAGVLILQIM